MINDECPYTSISLILNSQCVFFFKAYPGAATLGHPIPLLSFAADLTLGAVPSR